MKITNTLLPWDKNWLLPDITSGLIVTIMLVPQAIAYAFLAGLPPQAGLFSALLPLIAYAILGTSPTLAVGPVAIISLLTLSSLSGVVSPGAADYPAYAALLALLTGAWLLVFYAIGLGSWTSFISHSVVSGFTSAAAIVIILSQLKYFTGLDIPKGGPGWEPLTYLSAHWQNIQAVPVILGISGIFLLLLWQKVAPRITQRLPLADSIRTLINRLGALVLILSGAAAVWFLSLETDTVGTVPQGWPDMVIPDIMALNWEALLVPSAALSLIIFLESLSIANTMARDQRRRILPNNELLALSAANIAAGVSQAMPVAGGFGRSMVMVNSGARSQWSGVVTFILMASVSLMATDWFEYLPKAALGALIVVATWPLFRWHDGIKAWRFQRSDGIVWLATFATVLVINAETGILAGAALSLVIYLRRTSQPHIAEIGQLQGSEQFRNVLRHKVRTVPGVLLIRVDENLYFANSDYLIDYVLRRITDDRTIHQVIIVGTAINHVDFCGLEALELLNERLREESVQLHLAEFKGPVMDQLENSSLIDDLYPGRVFFTTADAIRYLQRQEEESEEHYTI